ncbi:MAG: FAD-dependent thymidylate synthase [Bacilli bacterium]|nr:FAD-dependent thymidylate synthase [Bacilli bacterium]
MNLKPTTPKVTLIAYTNPVTGGSAEKVVAAASKLCYANSSPSTLLEGLDDKATSDFLAKLSNYGHMSPVEHISFTFGIEGISRACSHQIVRHRIASYSQQSQRYVDLANSEVGFIVPPEVRENKALFDEYTKNVEEEFKAYADSAEVLYQKYLETLDENQRTKKNEQKLRKKAIEDARYLLPNACETKMVMTMNARSLLNFFRERCCNRAQWEIREVADQMLDLVYPLAPTIFENAGAPCLSGKCPEGAMSCGRPKVKKRGV